MQAGIYTCTVYSTPINSIELRFTERAQLGFALFPACRVGLWLTTQESLHAIKTLQYRNQVIDRSSAGACQFNTTQKLLQPYHPQAAWTQRKESQSLIHDPPPEP